MSAIEDYNETIIDLLDWLLADFADNEAALDGNKRLNYSELQTEVDALAKALLAAGIERGDRIALMGPSSLEFLLTFLAATSIGAIWFGLNPRYQIPEYAYLLQDAAPKLLFTFSPFEDRDYAVDLRKAGPDVPRLVVIGDTPSQADGYDAFLAAGSTISDEELLAAKSQVKPGDTAVIVYTSGTTGKPKGAMLSHGAIVSSARANAAHMDISPAKALCCLPINHVASLNNITMNVMAGAGCTVFHPRLDPSTILAMTASENLTYMVTSPTLLMMLLAARDFNIEKLKTLQVIVFGGSATPLHLIEQFVDTGAALYAIYGATETCGIVSCTSKSDTLQVASDTIGKPIDGASWRVADSNNQVCETGVTGEMQIKGPHILSGYFNNLEASAACMTADGFFRTGDLCFMREDGNAQFAGRLKEMFKSGAYNIYPLEIETAMEQHPDISLAVVLGVPSKLYQEVGYAFIKAAPGSNLDAKSLKDWLKTRLANFKIPKYFEFVDELPLLPNTKVDKMQLRTRLDTKADRFV